MCLLCIYCVFTVYFLPLPYQLPASRGELSAESVRCSTTSSIAIVLTKPASVFFVQWSHCRILLSHGGRTRLHAQTGITLVVRTLGSSPHLVCYRWLQYPCTTCTTRTTRTTRATCATCVTLCLWNLPPANRRVKCAKMVVIISPGGKKVIFNYGLFIFSYGK